MKIVFCINNIYSLGGGQRVLSQRVNYFVKNTKYKIYIITTDQKQKSCFYFFDPSIKIIDLEINYREDKNNFFLLRKLKVIYKRKKHLSRLNKLINEINPDVIAAHGTEEKWIIPELKYKCKKILERHIEKKAVLKEANNFFRKIKGYLTIYREEMLIKKYDEFIILTEEDREQWNKPKIKVIPNSLTFYPSEVSKCENKKIISVGRLEYEKGYDILIEVWKEVFEKHKDWILEIYGEGSLRKELEEKIEKLGLENSLLLKGTVSNIQEKYLESSIYVMTSRYEGLPMVLIEAMACGLPLVSFDCPCGPKDVITDKEDGYICKFGNIEEMAKKICDLIENEEKRKKFGKKARENSLRYEESKIMNQWKNLFENLIEK